MNLPPFDYKREREEYVNDGSVETTIRVTAFFRVVTYAYSKPIPRWRRKQLEREREKCRARGWHQWPDGD